MVRRVLFALGCALAAGHVVAQTAATQADWLWKKAQNRAYTSVSKAADEELPGGFITWTADVLKPVATIPASPSGDTADIDLMTAQAMTEDNSVGSQQAWCVLSSGTACSSGVKYVNWIEPKFNSSLAPTGYTVVIKDNVANRLNPATGTTGWFFDYKTGNLSLQQAATSMLCGTPSVACVPPFNITAYRYIGPTLSTYLAGIPAGTVTSVSVVTANGVSGSVATATTTPAITLTLGAITPSSVAASGTVTGSNLSGTNTGDDDIPDAIDYSNLTGGNGIANSPTGTLALAPLTANWNQTGAFDLFLNNAGSELQILESAGATFVGTIDVGDLSANASYSFTGPSGTVLTTANYTTTLDSVYVNVAETPTAGDVSGSFSIGFTIVANSVDGTNIALGSDAQGDMMFYDGTDWVRLAKNASATRYLSNTGTTNNPAWAQVNLANGVTGLLPFASVNVSGYDGYFFYGNGASLSPTNVVFYEPSIDGLQFNAALTEFNSPTATIGGAVTVLAGGGMYADPGGTIIATAVPVGGVTGLGSGVGTFLATPSSANLAAAITNETGSGLLVFATSPTFTNAVTIGSNTGSPQITFDGDDTPDMVFKYDDTNTRADLNKALNIAFTGSVGGFNIATDGPENNFDVNSSANAGHEGVLSVECSDLTAAAEDCQFVIKTMSAGGGAASRLKVDADTANNKSSIVRFMAHTGTGFAEITYTGQAGTPVGEFQFRGATGGQTFDTALLPATDLTPSAGSSILRWLKGWFGSVAIRPGSATSTNILVGGVLKHSITQAGNTALTETSLWSYSVPAATLATDGDSLDLWIGGTFGATVSTNKTLLVKFGGTTVFTSGALTAAESQKWRVQCDIIRTAATTQDSICSLSTSGVPTGVSYASFTSPAETLSGAVTLDVRGNGTNASDVIFEIGKLHWNPAGL